MQLELATYIYTYQGHSWWNIFPAKYKEHIWSFANHCFDHVRQSFGTWWCKQKVNRCIPKLPWPSRLRTRFVEILRKRFVLYMLQTTVSWNSQLKLRQKEPKKRWLKNWNENKHIKFYISEFNKMKLKWLILRVIWAAYWSWDETLIFGKTWKERKIRKPKFKLGRFPYQ